MFHLERCIDQSAILWDAQYPPVNFPTYSSHDPGTKFVWNCYYFTFYFVLNLLRFYMFL